VADRVVSGLHGLSDYGDELGVATLAEQSALVPDLTVRELERLTALVGQPNVHGPAGNGHAAARLVERASAGELSPVAGLVNGARNGSAHLHPAIAAGLPNRAMVDLVEEDEVALLAALLGGPGAGNGRHRSARLAELLARRAIVPGHLQGLRRADLLEGFARTANGSSLHSLEETPARGARTAGAGGNGAALARSRAEGIVRVPRIVLPATVTVPPGDQLAPEAAAAASPATERTTKGKPRSNGAAPARKTKPRSSAAAPARQRKPKAAATGSASEPKPRSSAAASRQRKPKAATAGSSSEPKAGSAAAAPARQRKPKAAAAGSASEPKPRSTSAASRQRKPKAATAGSSSEPKAGSAAAAPARQRKPKAAAAGSSSEPKPRSSSATPARQRKPRAKAAPPTPAVASSPESAPRLPDAAPTSEPKPRSATAAPARQRKPRPVVAPRPRAEPSSRDGTAGPKAKTRTGVAAPVPAVPAARSGTATSETTPVATRAPLDESLEAVPLRYRRSLAVRLGVRTLQLVCLLYAAGVLWWLWLAKELSVTAIFADPLVYGYSVVITAYILARFAFGLLYRPTPDRGYRPSLSIVIPVFNEGESIRETVEACYEARYPRDRLEVVAIDDGSTDGSWLELLELRRRFPSLVCVRFPENRGKRAAMAEGVRRSRGAICVFIDSDSVIEPDGLEAIVQDFTDKRVGAVVGHAHVLNKETAWIPQMQQVRYFVAFRILKGAESLFGAVTCASGCFSAYRRQALAEVLREWEAQVFLGRRATYGDDRALTNRVLEGWRVVYQSRAVCYTIVPTGLRQFMRQQLRWKKSWLRESLYLSRIIWRKHPIAAALTYTSIVCGWVAPLVVLRAIVIYPLQGDGEPAFYAAGVYAIALLGCLYYAVARRSPLWWQGLTYAAMYVTLLIWQLYYALATLRNTAWGTRASSHSETAGETIVIRPEPPVPPSPAPAPARAGGGAPPRARRSRAPALAAAVETEGH
jgi:hyaluronan synthase